MLHSLRGTKLDPKPYDEETHYNSEKQSPKRKSRKLVIWTNSVKRQLNDKTSVLHWLLWQGQHRSSGC